jgi:uncharacterized protein YoxC
MDVLVAISVTVIALVMVIALVFLISFALQARRAAREAERFFEAARRQIAPLSHDLTLAMHEINGVVRTIHSYVDGAGEGADAFRGVVRRFRDIEGALSRLEEPLIAASALARAVGKGVGASVRHLRR